MKKFEAKCLEEVYELAAADFKCSITELDINLIQQPSKGFLGFGKKTAIIEVCFKDNCKRYETETTTETFRKKDIQIDDVSKRINDSNKNDELVKSNLRSQNKPILNEVPKDNSKNKIFDNFYNEDKSQTEMSTLVVKKNKDELLNEITEAINLLFKDTCYEIDNIKINFYDDETLYVEFTGKDSALLITIIRSALQTAERRWDTIIVVAPCVKSRIFDNILSSVSASKLENASSNTRIVGLISNARAIAIRWICPPESDIPRSPTTVSKPFGNRFKSANRPDFFTTSLMSSFEASLFPKIIFSLIVAENR